MDSSRYDPDSARSGSHVLVPLKKHPTAVVVNVKQAVTSLLHKFDTDLYAEIQTLVQQYEK
jgi:hypothetical protein